MRVVPLWIIPHTKLRCVVDDVKVIQEPVQQVIDVITTRGEMQSGFRTSQALLDAAHARSLVAWCYARKGHWVTILMLLYCLLELLY